MVPGYRVFKGSVKGLGEGMMGDLTLLHPWKPGGLKEEQNTAGKWPGGEQRTAHPRQRLVGLKVHAA